MNIGIFPATYVEVDKDPVFISPPSHKKAPPAPVKGGTPPSLPAPTTPGKAPPAPVKGGSPPAPTTPGKKPDLNSVANPTSSDKLVGEKKGGDDKSKLKTIDTLKFAKWSRDMGLIAGSSMIFFGFFDMFWELNGTLSLSLSLFSYSYFLILLLSYSLSLSHTHIFISLSLSVSLSPQVHQWN